MSGKTRLWYPRYVRDFKAKTGHLSLAEKGAYSVLMDEYWERQGPLPADDKALCRLLGAFPDEWAEVRENVLAFFKEQEGKLYHKRIEEEIKNAAAKYEAKAERMAKARAKRWAENGQIIEQKTDGETEQITEAKTNQIITGETPSPSQVTKVTPRCSLGEEFWQAFPHPPNRGSKSKVVEKINKLPEQEQRDALASLAAHKAAIDETRKRNKDFQPCMAETFVNGRRWEGLEPVGSSEIASRETIWPDDPEERERAEALQRRVGKRPYASYFARTPPKKNCEGWVVTIPNTTVQAKVENQYSVALDDIYGRKQWRMEIDA